MSYPDWYIIEKADERTRMLDRNERDYGIRVDDQEIATSVAREAMGLISESREFEIADMSEMARKWWRKVNESGS